VEVILRLLVVKRRYDWSSEETEHFVAHSLVLRQFCRVYLQPVPDDTTRIRWANLIGPETVARLNDRVVELARAQRVTRGASCAWTARWWRPRSTTRPTAASLATACAS
jgi:IS5 family transposase